jgi:hypothetical protein
MDFDKNLVARFDLGDILGEARFLPPPPEFVGFIVFPHVFEVLAPPRQDNQWFGIVSDTGDNTGDAVSAALELSSLLSLFCLQLQLYSRDIRFLKGEPQIVCLAAEPTAGCRNTASLAARMIGSGTMPYRRTRGVVFTLCW